MEDSRFVGRVEDVVLIPAAGPALKRLTSAGYRLFVVTNQSGVGRGFFTLEDVERVHAFLRQHFREHGVEFERFLVCPHHPDEGCDCRKPEPKLILDAASEFGLDLDRCFMVGDRRGDIEAGINAGIKTVLVLTGVGREQQHEPGDRPDHVARDIEEAAEWILGPA